MKLSIERATLLKALAQAQSVVERRNTIPILANVLIEAEGAQVSLPRDRPGHRGGGPRARNGRTCRRHHGFGGDAARNRAQAARWRAGQPVRRQRLGASDDHRRAVDLQPGDAAERRFPGDGPVGIFLELRCQGAGAAPVVRQGEIRDLDRRDPLLPERRLHACFDRSEDGAGAALCGDRRPPPCPDRRALPKGPRACPA
jgi:hypothetical protein